MSLIQNSKAELRKKIRTIHPENRIGKDQAINQFVFGLEEFINAKVVFLFNSIKDEPDTSCIIAKALEDKLVGVPSTNYDKIEFVLLNPQYCDNAQSALLVPDLVFVPCMAFDNQFNRLGRGLGWYDRFLKNLNSLKVGIAYSDYETINVFATDLDIPMDIIITDNGVLRPSTRRRS
ncbi:MAG: 5-formyltetrahydrofolate cyclo-ligase [Christensenellaceae bacterium]|jgi:5-formyltetrahydrofolate cyclo-ligase|nr:5-formyltetrahydrofolate cyclo-ligase [Christensenellaceae bacterium]